jgi:SPP1 gp7 family putative phage head morphogenesis protein
MTIEQSFDLPIRAAQAFWRGKMQLSPSQYGALSSEAKLRAFGVSGIAKGDELNTVFRALQRAIDEGISFEQFKADAGEVFELRGWVGKRSWRVNNIFQTNIQTAYNVGRYEQLQEEKEIMPYWMYDAINDAGTRKTHLAMDGRIWPADHAVWNTWYPPNGFNCRCSVSGVTRGQAERRGMQVEEDDPTDRMLEVVDKESGNALETANMIPEAGFDYNPGKNYWEQAEKMIRERIAGYPKELAALVEEELTPVLSGKTP